MKALHKTPSGGDDDRGLAVASLLPAVARWGPDVRSLPAAVVTAEAQLSGLWMQPGEIRIDG